MAAASLAGMIDLYKVGDVPYDDGRISLDELLTFSEAHLPLVLNDPVAPQVALELTAVGNALDALGASVSTETVKLGLQKARVAAKAGFRVALPNEMSKIYGAALEAFGQQGEEMEELFPEGRTSFDQCKDALLGAKLAALHTAVTTHAGALGAPMVALALTLKNNWQAVYQAAADAKGVKGGSATARREDIHALKTALGLLRLELGKQLLRQRDRLKSLFPQHLLGQPVEDSGGGDDDDGGTPPPPPPPEPPAAPQNVSLVDAGTGSGELGLNADPVAPPVDGYRLYNFGSEVASGSSLPLLATLTPGDNYALSLRAYNAGGESGPSDELTGTVP